MKGSMILSLVTLCVTMLFLADRISAYLQGPDSDSPAPDTIATAPAPTASSSRVDWSALWDNVAGLFTSDPSPPDNSTDSGDAVVITEDTLYRARVWMDPDGNIFGGPGESGDRTAREVLIPKGMSVEAFFAPAPTSPSATPNTPSASHQQTPNPQTPERAMTREERRQLLQEGLRVIQAHRNTETHRQP